MIDRRTLAELQVDNCFRREVIEQLGQGSTIQFYSVERGIDKSDVPLDRVRLQPTYAVG